MYTHAQPRDLHWEGQEDKESGTGWGKKKLIIITIFWCDSIYSILYLLCYSRGMCITSVIK